MIRNIVKIVTTASLLSSIIWWASNTASSASTQSNIYVSIGSQLGEQSTITTPENLTVGREWVLYDLSTAEYIGIARVVRASVTEGTCHCKYKSTLQLNQSVESYRQVLMLRLSSGQPESVEILPISFEQIPQSLQQNIINYWRSLSGWNQFRLGVPTSNEMREKITHYGSFKSIDINVDQTPDLIFTKIAMPPLYQWEEKVYMNQNSQWVVKFHHIGEIPSR
jgi:hypothetical protein